MAGNNDRHARLKARKEAADRLADSICLLIYGQADEKAKPIKKVLRKGAEQC
jgi:hypothetical protein